MQGFLFCEVYISIPKNNRYVSSLSRFYKNK